MPLFIDGARLGYGLPPTTATSICRGSPTIATRFILAARKSVHSVARPSFFPEKMPLATSSTSSNGHGALLAKSRLAGVQFDALFTDGFYFNIARHAIDMAMKMRQIFADASLEVKDSPTNQQFVVLHNDQLQQLMSKVLFETWEPIDNERTLCRFVTSWATTEADLQALSNALKSSS